VGLLESREKLLFAQGAFFMMCRCDDGRTLEHVPSGGKAAIACPLVRATMLMKMRGDSNGFIIG
jgi:hypothetical protein